jgi:hypothetical protein
MIFLKTFEKVSRKRFVRFRDGTHLLKMDADFRNWKVAL